MSPADTPQPSTFVMLMGVIGLRKTLEVSMGFTEKTNWQTTSEENIDNHKQTTPVISSDWAHILARSAPLVGVNHSRIPLRRTTCIRTPVKVGFISASGHLNTLTPIAPGKSTRSRSVVHGKYSMESLAKTNKRNDSR